MSPQRSLPNETTPARTTGIASVANLEQMSPERQRKVVEEESISEVAGKPSPRPLEKRPRNTLSRRSFLESRTLFRRQTDHSTEASAPCVRARFSLEWTLARSAHDELTTREAPPRMLS